MQEKIMLWQGEAPYTEYSKDQAQPSLTAFPVEGADTAIVVCPGGGYAMKAPHEGAPIAEMLNRGGIAAYVLDYRVAPCHTDCPVTDALRAIRVVRAMGYACVGILGFSAGGHLTCSAATMYDQIPADESDPVDRISARPDLFIPCYPVVSFVNAVEQGTCRNLLGEHPDRDQLVRFSNEQNVNEQTPPAFIWHTANDECVPVLNSLMLAASLAKAGVYFDLRIYPEGVHGLGLAEDHEDIRKWADDCVSFIHRVSARVTGREVKA